MGNRVQACPQTITPPPPRNSVASRRNGFRKGATSALSRRPRSRHLEEPDYMETGVAVMNEPSRAEDSRRDAVTALVLNWNGEADTTACIDSLAAQRGVTVEILLIDNASADGSGERLHARYPGLPYLQTGANLGYAGGNNAG